MKMTIGNKNDLFSDVLLNEKLKRFQNIIVIFSISFFSLLTLFVIFDVIPEYF